MASNVSERDVPPVLLKIIRPGVVKGMGETEVSRQLLDLVQNFKGRLHEFRPDAVSGDHYNAVNFHLLVLPE
jgi:hypothetical protein